MNNTDFKKSKLEKLGDSLEHLGKRALIFLIISVIGGAFIALGAILPPVAFIGAPLLVVGVYCLISVFDKRKTYLEASVTVRSRDGKEIPCTVLKRKYYAYMPLFPFLCPFFYIPYKTCYLLIENYPFPAEGQKQKIPELFINSGIVHYRELCKAEYKALISDPQLFADEICESIKIKREQFCTDIAPFVETGLAEEMCFTDQYSICRGKDDTNLLFFYSRPNNYQRAIALGGTREELLETLTHLMSALILTNTFENNIIEMSNVALERLLNSPEFKQDVDKNAARKVINDMNREKKPITRELILSSLKSTCITKKLGWGIFYAFWCVLLVVCGFTGGLPTIIIFTVLGGGFTGWLAVDFIKTGIKYKKTLVNGKYRIIKAACTRIEDKSDDESDFYLCHFENGAAISGVLPVCVEGDYFYFVYPDGDKEHQLYYNALDYAPAPGLTYEDFNPAYSPIETR